MTQWGNVAGLVAGFCTNDLGLISRSMQDVVIEPMRAMLIPCFDELRQLALEQQALGFGISGSGPSVFALCSSLSVARNVTAALEAKLAEAGIGSTTYVSEINLQGPVIKPFQTVFAKP